MFLLESGGDMNSPRRVRGGGQAGGGDQLTPLHLCASYGLQAVATALTSRGARVNSKVGGRGVVVWCRVVVVVWCSVVVVVLSFWCVVVYVVSNIRPMYTI